MEHFPFFALLDTRVEDRGDKAAEFTSLRGDNAFWGKTGEADKRREYETFEGSLEDEYGNEGTGNEENTDESGCKHFDGWEYLGDVLEVPGRQPSAPRK